MKIYFWSNQSDRSKNKICTVNIINECRFIKSFKIRNFCCRVTLVIILFGLLLYCFKKILNYNKLSKFEEKDKSAAFDLEFSSQLDSIDLNSCIIEKFKSKIVRYKYDVDCKAILSLNQVNNVYKLHS